MTAGRADQENLSGAAKPGFPLSGTFFNGPHTSRSETAFGQQRLVDAGSPLFVAPPNAL